jgi:hypothetical protein
MLIIAKILQRLGFLNIKKGGKLINHALTDFVLKEHAVLVMRH